MSDFTPTPEQATIVAAGTDTKDNLLVSALAGAAKTSTLVLLGHAIKSSILCLAFNVKIAKEMDARLPGNCESRTLNSLGHKAWGDYLGKRLTVDSKKTYRIVRELIDAMPSGEAKSHAFEFMADIMRAVDSGKTAGYIPTGHFKMAKPLMDDADFFAWLDEEPSEVMAEIIREATLISIREALNGLIDYGDQLLMPTCWPVIFPYYPVVMIDEAQDLSALNHVMLAKVAKKRLIAVGDPCQAIYGFRGAHEDSMSLLKKQFNMTELHLTVSFRCPVAVVEHARWRAPAMQYPDWAKPGNVERLNSWSIEDIPSGDVAIICRNNAPLFKMALRMLRDGRYPELVGNEIGRMLIKILKKLGEPRMRQREVFAGIDEWKTVKLEKSRSPERVHDTAACLRIFAEAGATLGEAIDYAERIMSVTGPTKLMTGHKSKGLEFDTVFILDKELLRLKDGSQDRNLLYVMQTRAKDRLIYVDSDNYFSERDDENVSND